MDSTRLEKGLFNFTAGIVFVFAFILCFNLLSFRPLAQAISASQRQPAAVGKTGASLAQTLSRVADMEHELPCLKNGGKYSILSPTARLRIQSQLCSENSEITESVIVNKTNGFVATVFNLNARQFTTDLIDLKSGENLIFVSHSLANGEKIMAELVVNYP